MPSINTVSITPGTGALTFGSSPTTSVGATSTTAAASASTTSSSTSSSSTGATGATGATGQPGPTGPTGPVGATGPYFPIDPVAGSFTIGDVGNALTITPGSTSSTGIVLSQSGTGGISLSAPLALTGAGTGLSVTNTPTFNNTAMHESATVMVNGTSPTTEFQYSHPGNFSTQAFATGITVPSTSTAYESDAFAAYVNNGKVFNATTGVGGASAGLFYARNSIAGATSWALNPLVTDQNSSGTGGFASTIMGAEFDIGAFNTGSSAYGINMIGVFPNGTPATAIAYQVAILNAPWQWAFVSGDGSTENGILLGSTAATANSFSQGIQFNVRDTSNTPQICGIVAQPLTAGATLDLNCPSGALNVLTKNGIWATTATTSTTGTYVGHNNVSNFTGASSPASATAYQVAALSHPWGYAFASGDGSATNGFLVGSVTASASSDSQPIILTTRDSTNAVFQSSIQATHLTGGSNLTITCAGSGGLIVNGNMSVSGATSLTQGLGVFGTTPPSTAPTITGSRGGATATVLQSLLSALSACGLIIDSTTA